MTQTGRFWMTLEGAGLIAAIIASWVIAILVARGLGWLILQLTEAVGTIAVRLI